MRQFRHNALTRAVAVAAAAVLLSPLAMGTIEKTWVTTGPDEHAALRLALGSQDETHVVGAKLTVTTSSATPVDLWVAKHNARGTVMWSNDYVMADDQMGVGIDVDANGDVVVAGYTSSGGALQHGFVARLESDGDLVWVYNHTQGSLFYDVAFAADGSIVAAGGAEDSGGRMDTLVTVLSSAGGHVSSHTYDPGAELREAAVALELEDDGSIFLAALVEDANDKNEAHLLKVNPDKSLAYRVVDSDSGLEITPGGMTRVGSDTYVAGFEDGPVNTDAQARITKYDSAGNLVWQRHWKPVTNSLAKSLDIAADDTHVWAIAAHLTGLPNEPLVDLDDEGVTIHIPTSTASGESNFTVLKYTHGGTLDQVNQYDYHGDRQIGTGIAMRSDGRIAMTGINIDFGVATIPPDINPLTWGAIP